MSADVTRFLDAVTLTPVRARVLDDAFTAVPQYVPWPKAYGGDSVAQALASAIATVADDRVVHSSHSSFLRPVTILEPVTYEVERTRDGRGYSTRVVRGIQNDKVTFLSTVSFQVPEDGPIRQRPSRGAPCPESLPTTAEANARGSAEVPAQTREYWADGRSFDHRHVQGAIYTSQPSAVPAGDEASEQEIWIRAFDALPDDPNLHRIALAYTCDYSILEPSLRALGRSWTSPGLATASLDHAMWFHRFARADDWLLYEQESAGVQSGRALNTGRFYTADGSLVATVAQEGMIRIGADS